MTAKNLPLFVSGTVCKGFGRGSRELGIPTANFDQSIVDKYSNLLETGVYFGWAQVDGTGVHEMVMSVGWNPFYKNTHKSMETHIMHEYPNDFYGSVLRICIAGYIRPEMDFKGLDDLVNTIKGDIAKAGIELEQKVFQELKYDPFFDESKVKTNGSF